MRRLLPLLLLAGCSYVPASTLARLAAIDPITADPGQIELAVVMPPGMAPLPGTAKMTLHAEGGGHSRDVEYALADADLPQGVPLPDGAQVHAYRLTGSDAASLRALQAEVAGWDDTGHGRAVMGVALDGCRIGTGPAADATGAVYARLETGGAFLPLLGPARLTDMLGAAAMADLPACP